MIEKPIFLTQGNDPNVVADAFVEFVSKATKSLHIAIYDFQLNGSLKDKVVEALEKKADEGVEVFIAYDHTKANQGKTNKGTDASDPEVNDPAPRGTMVFVITNFPTAGKVKTRPISGHYLMHNKYIVRDGGTHQGAVWMGSANFTLGAWSLQENNILRIDSPELADHYQQDFNDLWNHGDILGAGKNDYDRITEAGSTVEMAFSPGEGSTAASLFVDAIQGAGSKIWLATMVLSSGTILGSLCDYLDNNGEITGIYDATQMQHVEEIWNRSNSPKLPQWKRIKKHLVGKHSTPFGEKTPHDFMHNKILLTDKTVVTGSFNLSGNAEKNAENVLSIHNATILVDAYKQYIESLMVKYNVKLPVLEE